ncbi:unnamed protein product, partial [marine sediment metagenome]
AQIALKKVIEALEGSLSLAECIDSPRVCRRVSACVTRDLLEEMGEKITEVLESTTLEDMVNRARAKQKLRPLMYSI